MDFFNKELYVSATFGCSNKIKFYCMSLLLFLVVSGQVQAQVQFQNTTNSIGGPFHTGESWGASWGHLDNDVYPDLFVNNHGMKNSLLRNNGNGSFSERVDSADLSGIMAADPTADIHGGAWGDYDNDGDQDLFLTRSSKGSRLYLFENNGQGQFTERGYNEGVNAVGGGRMAMLFDYNNDGRLDLATVGNEGNDLFRWNGSHFADVGSQAGVNDTCRAGTSAAASDFFNTGSPIYLCSSSAKIIESAYDTNGGSTPFTDVSNKFDHIGSTPDVVLADFNNDLKMDMFALRGIIRPVGAEKISNNRIEAWISRGGTQDYFASFSFSATGPITIDVSARNVNKIKRDTIHLGDAGYHPSSVPFTLSPNNNVNHGSAFAPEYRAYGLHVEYDPASQLWTVTLSGGGSGSSEGAFIKIDGNGFSEPVMDGLIYMDLPVAPRFLLNNGSRLVNSNSRGIGNIMCGGIAAADFDNDMDVDLYLACRTSIENTENRLYLNNGSGTFSLASNTGGEGLLGAGIDSGAGTAEIAVTADYDVDGFIDLFVTNGNRLFPHFVQDGYSAGGPDQFYRNTTNNGNKWLELDLQGVTSNRDGFGAKVIVTAGGVSQLREQNGQYHRWSHDHKRLHFGLADNNTANIQIEWPDGSIDTHAAVSVNKLYNAIQGGALVDITPSGGNTGTSTLSINSAVQVEGNSAILTVSRTLFGSPISVDYETVAQSAMAGADYATSSGTLNFNSNQSSQTISIDTLTDDLLEGDENFSVLLSNPVGATIVQGSGIVTITDTTPGGGNDCGEPNYNTSLSSDKGLYVWQDCVNPDKWSIRANAGGGSWTTFDGSVSSDLAIGSINTVSFESSDSFQLSDSDQNLDFFMGMANAGQDGLDYLATSGADLCLSLANNSSIFYGVNAVPVVSPLNLNDVGNTCTGSSSLPAISINDTLQAEGSAAELTLSLSSAGTSLVTVDYATIAQSAISGADYIAQSGTISFAVAETSQPLLVSTLTDALIEGDEDFIVVLSNPVGATIDQGTGTVTITDATSGGGNDCGEPSYNTSQSADKGLYVWQDCTNPTKWSISVNAGGGSWTTFDGAVNSDLAIDSVNTIGFESSDNFLLLDSDRELDFFMGTANVGEDALEFFSPTESQLCLTLNVDRPIFYGVNAVAALSPLNLNDIAQVCGTDNSIPLVTVNNLSVLESAGVAELTVSLSQALADTVSVDYLTIDGSAVTAADYIAQSGTITFAPGEVSKIIAITIVADATAEVNEAFSLALSNAIGVQIAASGGVITITEADNLLACGMPSISAVNEAALFIWKDCGDTERWSFRATAGGGSSIQYTGTIDSDQAISSVTTFSFEGIDNYQLTNADQTLDFVMKMSGNGADGISLDLGLSTSSCVDVQSTTSVPVLVGSQKTTVTPPFSLDNLGPC